MVKENAEFQSATQLRNYLRPLMANEKTRPILLSMIAKRSSLIREYNSLTPYLQVAHASDLAFKLKKLKKEIKQLDSRLMKWVEAQAKKHANTK